MQLAVHETDLFAAHFDVIMALVVLADVAEVVGKIAQFEQSADAVDHDKGAEVNEAGDAAVEYSPADQAIGQPCGHVQLGSDIHRSSIHICSPFKVRLS